MDRKLKEAIATRQLYEVGAQEKVITIAIGKPRKDRDKEWVCQFQIMEASISRIHDAFGVDGVQVLLNAVEGLRVTLEETGRRFSWIGGEEGDVGLPRAVPTFFGRQFADRINRVIDEEIERFSGSAEGQP